MVQHKIDDLTLRPHGRPVSPEVDGPPERRGAAPPTARLEGCGAAYQDLMVGVRRAAATSASVLITGETGTGKEVAAREIHRLSPQAGGPFVAVNCAEFSESMLEAELFGRVKGAFTGADRSRSGLIEAANDGTFLLDEVGDLPMRLQSKLLRVLQEGEVRRIGENRATTVRARFIAATNLDMRAAVDAGRCRRDLYYRLAVIEVRVPPLRERREDIPMLVERILEEMRALGARASLPPRALERLLSHDFPGNIRELKNLVTRLTLAAEDGAGADAEIAGIISRGAGAGAPRTLREHVDAAEGAAIRAALSRTAGRVGEAARILDVSTVTLWRRMRRHGIER